MTIIKLSFVLLLLHVTNNASAHGRIATTEMAPPKQHTLDEGETAIVFFDLETSGLKDDCEVLEIAMKSGNKTFKEYITPTKPIPAGASAVNKLTNVDGQLYLNGQLQYSQPAEKVLRDTLSFLQSIGKPCTLTAHNCDFDASRLVRLIKIYNLESEFAAVIRNFVDTLQLFREKFPERNKPGKLKLTALVEAFLDIPTDRAHTADYDVLMLEQLTIKHFSYEETVKNARSFSSYANRISL